MTTLYIRPMSIIRRVNGRTIRQSIGVVATAQHDGVVATTVPAADVQSAMALADEVRAFIRTGAWRV